MRFAAPIAYLLFLSALTAASVLPYALGRIREGEAETERQNGALSSARQAQGSEADTLDTEEASCEVFFFCGDRGDRVEMLQNGLAALGYEVGEHIGVYTPRTAEAVAQFQRDIGAAADGTADAFLLSAVSARIGEPLQVSEESLCQALCDAGCMKQVPVSASLSPRMLSPSDTPTGALRDALILFQRTHGLRGTGGIGYATLCALGLVPSEETAMQARDTASQDRRCDAIRDMRIGALADALLAYTSRYPDAAQLYTLTALASVMINRIAHPAFSDSPEAVFSAGLLFAQEGEVSSERTADPRLRRICLLAAEEAWETFLGGGDLVGGAVYTAVMKDSLPENAAVTKEIGRFLFYR